MGKTLRRFTSHEEERTETYRYWHARPDSEIYNAIWEMSDRGLDSGALPFTRSSDSE